MDHEHHDGLALREELFLLAHDEHRHGRCLVHVPALALGLAGAVLIDLLRVAAVAVDPGGYVINDPYDRRRHVDLITQHALAAIRTTRAVHGAPPVPQVLRLLSLDLYERTRAGLIASGQLRRTTRRLGRDRYTPTDLTTIVRIRARVRSAVNGSPDIDPITDALAALTRVLGLGDALYATLDTDELDDRLTQITARIPHTSPDCLVAVPHIADAVQATIGDLATAAYR